MNGQFSPGPPGPPGPLTAGARAPSYRRLIVADGQAVGAVVQLSGA